MPNWKQMKSDTLSGINTAMTVLNKFPSLPETNSYISVDMSVNPIAYCVDLLKTLGGYDYFVKIVSKAIFVGVEALEPLVKTALITRLQEMNNCSVNPFIPDKMLQEGFVFDIRQLDILNIMRFSPLDDTSQTKKLFGKTYKIHNPGRYYYFLDDGAKLFKKEDESKKITEPDQLIHAADFNAFLWYTKNRTKDRTVWFGSKRQHDEQPKSTNAKQQKKDGIITLEYSPYGNALTSADGSGLTMQVPFNNCVHVFIGNAAPIYRIDETQLHQTRNEIADLRARLKSYTDIIDNIDYAISVEQEMLAAYNSGKIDLTDANTVTRDIKSDITRLTDFRLAIGKDERISANHSTLIRLIDGKYYVELYMFDKNGNFRYGDTLTVFKDKKINPVVFTHDEFFSSNPLTLQEYRAAQQAESNYMTSSAPTYRDIKKNYYYHRTLAEFNYDYVMSLKLFDSRVIAAQLIDALTGCMNIDLNMTYEEQLVKEETKKMMEDVAVTDTYTVSDCFFTFSNDEYNTLLERTNEIRAGVYTPLFGNTTGAPVDANSIMDQLNSMNENATLEEFRKTFDDVLNNLSQVMSNETGDGKKETNLKLSAELNFLENLLDALAYTIVITMISPKLYLLLGINLQIMGQKNSMDVREYIVYFKQLLLSICRTVKEWLLKAIQEEIMKIVGELAGSISGKLLKEQMDYYYALLQRCITCFSLYGFGMSGGEGFEVSTAGADIYDVAGENNPEDTEC